MTRRIRLLPWSAAPADYELASSAAMLAGVEETGQPAMRWYEMAPPALVLGSGQRPADVNIAACAALGVPVVRRSSGGGAVFTGVSLSLDVALPPDDPLDSHDITESYRWLGEVWVAALASLGIHGRLVSVAEARADAQGLSPLLKRVCYAGLSPMKWPWERGRWSGWRSAADARARSCRAASTCTGRRRRRRRWWASRRLSRRP